MQNMNDELLRESYQSGGDECDIDQHLQFFVRMGHVLCTQIQWFNSENPIRGQIYIYMFLITGANVSKVSKVAAHTNIHALSWPPLAM